MSAACAICQSTNLEDAEIVRVTLTRASALRNAMSRAGLEARVCMDCGAVDRLRTDPEALQRLLGDSPGS